MATATARPARRPAPRASFPARIGERAWGLLTSVDFAVLQITVLALLSVVGIVLEQLPGFAFRSPADYAEAMGDLRARYEPVLGPGLVTALERLQLFRVFTSAWFSAGLVVLILSIVACTIDRLPRLWRESAAPRLVQADAFYDPELPDRATVAGAGPGDLAAVLRRHGYAVRVEERGGATYLTGDRNRWNRMATLLTHLGLILFLVAAAVTARFGDELGLVVAEGEAITVQPIGTPGLLLVRNLGFEAPGFETGRPTDFTTRLAVYRGGERIAERTIRVNEPLEAGGFTFHQNGFGPAPEIVIRDLGGRPLWDGPVPMSDEAAGFPVAELTVPGRQVVLQLLLDRGDDGVGVLLVLPFVPTGTNPDGSMQATGLEPFALVRGGSDRAAGTDFTVELRDFAEFTLLIAKRDPGQGIVWIAAALLLAGLAVTFWLPRRRIWARAAPGRPLALAVVADRYVDVGREVGAILAELVARRDGAPGRRPGAA